MITHALPRRMLNAEQINDIVTKFNVEWDD
jgi:hypothetical protein